VRVKHVHERREVPCPFVRECRENAQACVGASVALSVRSTPEIRHHCCRNTKNCDCHLHVTCACVHACVCVCVCVYARAHVCVCVCVCHLELVSKISMIICVCCAERRSSRNILCPVEGPVLHRKDRWEDAAVEQKRTSRCATVVSNQQTHKNTLDGMQLRTLAKCVP